MVGIITIVLSVLVLIVNVLTQMLNKLVMFNFISYEIDYTT